MRKMARSQAKAFRDRWHAVAAAEAEERRRASLLLRWQQMNALRNLMMGIKLSPPSSVEQERIAWERWARLRALHE